MAKGTVGIRAPRQGCAWWVRGDQILESPGAGVRSLVIPQRELETLQGWGRDIGILAIHFHIVPGGWSGGSPAREAELVSWYSQPPSLATF